MAFITKAKDHSKGYMTICAAMLKLKGRSPPNLRSKSLKSLIGKTLEDSLENTVDTILLHELTHIDSFWRDKALGKLENCFYIARIKLANMDRKDDATMNDGEPAYTFTGVHQLAGDDNDVTIIKKIRPLKSAGKNNL